MDERDSKDATAAAIQVESAETDSADLGVRIGRWAAVALSMILLAAGVYVVFGLEKSRRADECLSSGLRRCTVIDVREAAR